MIYLLSFRDRAEGGAVTSGQLSVWEDGRAVKTGPEAEGLLAAEARVSSTARTTKKRSKTSRSRSSRPKLASHLLKRSGSSAKSSS